MKVTLPEQNLFGANCFLNLPSRYLLTLAQRSFQTTFASEEVEKQVTFVITGSNYQTS